MTARHDPRDPLTPEERAMAALLGASSTGPSPALDARILAAARDAAQQPSPVKAPPATSVPAAAINADGRRRKQRPRSLRWARVAGMAASMVLVVGLGWRLALDAPMQREVAADQAAAPANEESAVLMQSPGAPLLPPPPQSVVPSVAEEAASDAASAAPSSRDAHPVAQAANAPTQKEMAPPPPASKVSAEAAPTAFPAPAPAPAAPAPPPAATRAADSARPQQSETRNARALSPVAAPTASTGTAASADGGALDRVEVAGSRIRMVDVEISDDARLPIAAWFERIRLRRDEGDLDGARGSLARFRAQHPRIAIPDDLRALDVGAR